MVLYMPLESGVTLLLNKLKPQCFVPKLVEIDPVLLEKISKSRLCIFTIFLLSPLGAKDHNLPFCDVSTTQLMVCLFVCLVSCPSQDKANGVK